MQAASDAAKKREHELVEERNVLTADLRGHINALATRNALLERALAGARGMCSNRSVLVMLDAVVFGLDGVCFSALIFVQAQRKVSSMATLTRLLIVSRNKTSPQTFCSEMYQNAIVLHRYVIACAELENTLGAVTRHITTCCRTESAGLWTAGQSADDRMTKLMKALGRFRALDQRDYHCSAIQQCRDTD